MLPMTDKEIDMFKRVYGVVEEGNIVSDDDLIGLDDSKEGDDSIEQTKHGYSDGEST